MNAHQRLRLFNTSDTYPDQNLDNDLCQAVVADKTVYLRGQVGTDFDGNLVGPGDPAAQAEQAMANVFQLLEEAGSEPGHIVKITVYITDPRHREPVYRVIGRWLKGVYPVSTGLVVSGLARPEWLMEIDVIAAIPEGESRQSRELNRMANTDYQHEATPKGGSDDRQEGPA